MTADTHCKHQTTAPHAAAFRIEGCVCRVDGFKWHYVEDRRLAIDLHWAQATAANPAYFDGIVLLTSACRLDPVNAPPSRIELTLFETRFRNFLYWRHHGFAGEGVVDAFGVAIVRARDGAILLVRQRPGNVNEGPYNLPSGFIDRSDVDEDGRVDLAANISREVEEEIGLGAGELTRRPGYIVTRVGVHLAVGVEYRSDLASDDLAALVRAFLSADENPEIAEIIFVHKREHFEGLDLAPHCRQILDALL